MCLYAQMRTWNKEEDKHSMFCSKCGKTIRPEDQNCPGCGSQIGDNRFGGIPYTSAQFTIKPGQKDFEPLNDYTRITYTGMEDVELSNSEADSRTTYRPVYEGASAPEDVRRDMRAAVAESNAEPAPEEEPEEITEEPVRAEVPVYFSPMAQETLDQLDEDLRPDEQIDRSQFKVRKIESAGRAGISKDVSDYIAKLESDQSRKGRHRRSEPVYDDYAGEQPYPQEYSDRPAGEYYDEQDGVFDEIDDEEFEDMRRRGRINPLQIIKIVLVLAVVAALFVGGVIWIRHISDNSSSAPIEGVSESLYEDGIALIKSHTESSYINERINAYRNEGPAAMALKINDDTNAINALLSAEPAPNDETFIKALQAIQSNVANALAMDALAVSASDADAVAKSEANWALVRDSVEQLESISTAAELTAIINGTKITITESTPAPTATPIVYKTLVKGDKNDEVMKMQQRLYELGYLNDDRDGNFGTKTQTAVKTFQERAGLDVTGLADNATLTLMYSSDAPYAAGVTTPTPAPTATPEPETETVIQPAEAQQAA